MNDAYVVRVAEDGPPSKPQYRGEVVEAATGVVVHTTPADRDHERAKAKALEWAMEMAGRLQSGTTMPGEDMTHGQWDRLVEMMRLYAGRRKGGAHRDQA